MSKTLIMVVVLFTSAFIFRLVLSFFGAHPDLLAFSEWGSWIAKNGTLNLYNASNWTYDWPSHPPLPVLIYAASFNVHGAIAGLLSNIGVFIALNHLGAGHIPWYFDFVKWFGQAAIPPTNIPIGQVVTIKLLAVISDILVALAFFLILKSLTSYKKAIILTALLLFFPFGWYISSFWGQYNQLAFLLMLIAILLLYKRQFSVAMIFLVLSFQIKPTIALILPFLAFYYFYQKPNFKNVVFSLVVIIALNALLVLPFSHPDKLISSAQSIYFKILFQRRNELIANHAFNFWTIIYPYGKVIRPADLLSLVSLMLALLINAIPIFFMKRNHSFKYALIGFYIVSAGTYLFGPGMLDRYYYPAILLLGLLIAYFPKLLWVWILTSLLFSFNVFYSWGFPLFQQYGQGWSNPALIRLMSLLNIGLFLISLKIMLRQSGDDKNEGRS